MLFLIRYNIRNVNKEDKMSFIKKPEDVAGGIDCGYDIYFHGKGEEARDTIWRTPI